MTEQVVMVFATRNDRQNPLHGTHVVKHLMRGGGISPTRLIMETGIEGGNGNNSQIKWCM